MAFDATLVVSDGTTNHTFEVIDQSKPLTTVRQVDPAGTNLDQFERLRIQHRYDEKTRVSSSVTEFSQALENETSGKIEVAKVRIVVEVPRATFASADVLKLITMTKNFLATAGYPDKIINLES